MESTNNEHTVADYNIYRSPTPFFDPATCSCVVAQGVTGESWSDSGVLGGSAMMYFYVMTAENNAGESAGSEQWGVFGFALEPGE